MPNKNEIVLIGHLGRDPDFKDVNGKTFARFSIATSEGKDQYKKTHWHEIDVLGEYAVANARSFKKGDCVMVRGMLVYDQWEKDGQKKTAAKIKSFECYGVTYAKAQRGDDAGFDGNKAADALYKPAEADDDLPF